MWTCTAQFLQYIDKGIVIEYTDFPTVDDDCGKHEPDTGSGWVQCPHILFSMYCNKTSDKIDFSYRFCIMGGETKGSLVAPGGCNPLPYVARCSIQPTTHQIGTSCCVRSTVSIGLERPFD